MPMLEQAGLVWVKTDESKLREANAAAFQTWSETPGKQGREDCHVKPPNLLSQCELLREACRCVELGLRA